jgi:glutathione S-transferase
MLEEVGQPYELRYVDLMGGEQRKPEFRALNPMGKIPVLVDGDVVVTETAAIGLYLADRYSLGTLAPRPDEPARATYLRWSLFSPSVIEPGAMAKARNWEYGAGQAGWGDYDSMIATVEHAIGEGPWLLGDRFTMADVILGSTLRFLLRFKMLEERERIAQYAERLAARPAARAADAKNAAVVEERGLRR